MWKTGSFVLIFLAVIAGVYYFSEKPKEESPTKITLTSYEEPDSTLAEPTLLYGVAIDSFDIFEGKVQWNENLAGILSEFGISNQDIYTLANACKGIFDVRKLKAGSPFTIIHEKDEDRTARQFIFEPDATEFIVFNLSDSIYVERTKKPIIKEEKIISASIQTSVWESITNQDESPMLVQKLVDVFAWQVDFFRIQRGDEFKVIYEQERVGDEVIGITKIVGAYFKHFDKEYYAVYHNQGGNSDYFDEEGNSTRKTFLRSPLDYYRISSRFSPRRFHPVLKRYKSHLGTDYAAPTGTPIRATGEGVIVEAHYEQYNGNFVKIRHNSNYTTQYLHMSKIAGGIRPGTHVSQGQTIGYVGSTGLANGPHVCYRFWKNGRQVDALNVDLPPSEPIDPSQLIDYLHAKNVMLFRLNNIQIPEDKAILAQIPLSQN